MERRSLVSQQSADSKAVSFSVPFAWCVLLALLYFLMISRLVGPGLSSDFPPPATAPKFRVDINQAPASELQALPDIGPAMAERIIRYREQHGDFHSPEDLTLVHGFGPKTLAALRSMLHVTPQDMPPQVAATR